MHVARKPLNGHGITPLLGLIVTQDCASVAGAGVSSAVASGRQAVRPGRRSGQPAQPPVQRQQAGLDSIGDPPDPLPQRLALRWADGGAGGWRGERAGSDRWALGRSAEPVATLMRTRCP